MKKIKTAIVGTGFMGKVHAENVRRLGNVEIVRLWWVAVSETAQKFADAMGIRLRHRQPFDDVLNNPEIDAVHICTPNVDHFPMSPGRYQCRQGCAV